MATKITDGSISDVMTGSAEKRIDVAPDGTLWYCLVDPRTVRFFYSTNGGATWRYSSGSDLALGQYSGAPSFFIDADGFAHLSLQRFSRDPQDVLYARGRPKSGGGWTWSTKTILPAGGRLGVDTDVVAFRNGNGWVAFLLYNIPAGTRVARVDISASGVLTVGATSIGPSTGYANAYSTLDFAHTGNGKTPSSTPHLFLGSGAMTNSRPVTVQRARYSSGNWLWESPQAVASGGQNITQTALTGIYDGTYHAVAWSADNDEIKFAEWTGASSTARRDPPVSPAGMGKTGALTMALVKGNIYLLAYGYGTEVVYATKLTRSTGLWSAWTQVAGRTSTADVDGKVQAVRYPRSGNVDFVYANRTGSAYSVFFAQIVARVTDPVTPDPTDPVTPEPVTPKAPALLFPAPGARSDMSNGASFIWQHSKTSNSDEQQAWRFRRTTSGVDRYWNAASQTWQTTSVTNVGSEEFTSFPAGSWPDGTHSWSVSTRSASGVNSPFATSRTVISATAPVVEVTSPSGLYYDDSNPIVEWNYTSARAQRSFEVRVVEVAVVTSPDLNLVWTSGVTNSSTARSARISTILDSERSYRAYVRSTDSAGSVSEWDYSEFAISLEPPAGPLVEVFRDVAFETDVPRTRLDLTARSNFMSAAQARVTGGWETTGTNTDFTSVDTDLVNQIELGGKLTARAKGSLGMRTILGTPPAAPYGQPALLGPLNFPVTENQLYTFSISVKSDAIRAARVWIRWFRNDTGEVYIEDDTFPEAVLATVGNLIPAFIDDSLSEQFATTVNSYTELSVTVRAPFGAVMGRPYLEIANVEAGEDHYFTRASFQPGARTAWHPGGYSQTGTIRVQRSEDGGASWLDIAQRVKPNYRQEAVFFDRSMPFGKELLYRAFTSVDTGIGGTLSSSASPLARFKLAADIWAIRDMTDDAAELNALVTEFSRSDEEAASVFRVAGREFPIVDTEGNQSSEGSLTVYVQRAQAEAMCELLRSGKPLVVQSPAGTRLYARFLKRDYRTEELANRSISAQFVEVN